MTPASTVGSVTRAPVAGGVGVGDRGRRERHHVGLGERVERLHVGGVAVGAVGTCVRGGPGVAGGQRELDDVVARHEVAELVAPENVGRRVDDRVPAGVDGRIACAVEQRHGDAGERRLTEVELTVLVCVDPHEVAERHDRHDAGVDRRVGDRATEAGGVGVGDGGGGEGHHARARGRLRAAGVHDVAVEAVAAGVRHRPGVAARQRESHAVVAREQPGERVAAVAVGAGGRDRGTERVERRPGVGGVAELDHDTGDRRLRRVELAVTVGVDPHQVAERHERHHTGVDRGVGDRAAVAGGVGVGDGRGGERDDVRRGRRRGGARGHDVAVDAVVGAGVRSGPHVPGRERELDAMVAGGEEVELVAPVDTGDGRGDGVAVGVVRRGARCGEEAHGDAGDRSLGGVEHAVAIDVEPDQVAERVDGPGRDRAGVVVVRARARVAVLVPIGVGADGNGLGDRLVRRRLDDRDVHHRRQRRGHHHGVDGDHRGRCAQPQEVVAEASVRADPGAGDLEPDGSGARPLRAARGDRGRVREARPAGGR